MQMIIDDDGVMHEVYTKKEVIDMLENLIIEVGNIKIERFNTVGDTTVGIIYKTSQEMKDDFIEILSSRISKIKENTNGRE